jgi:hypothetical protein
MSIISIPLSHSLLLPFIQNTNISAQSLNYNFNYNYYSVASKPYQPPGQDQAYPPQIHPVPAEGGPPNANAVFTILKQTVKEKGIDDMYPEARLRSVAAELDERDFIHTRVIVGAGGEISLDLAKLALFDVVFLLDDSASMRFNEGHIEELKFILTSVAFATGLFDRSGFSVRFMNSDIRGDNIRTGEEAAAIVDQVIFEGVTPLAASLKDKVLDPYVYGPDRAGILKKPLLVRIITYGKVYPDYSDIIPQLTTDSPPITLMASSNNISVRSRTISEGGEVRSLAFAFQGLTD